MMKRKRKIVVNNNWSYTWDIGLGRYLPCAYSMPIHLASIIDTQPCLALDIPCNR